MANYPDSTLKDQVLYDYERYLRSFLKGLPNTPLFSFQTYKAEDRFLDAYDYFIKTYPDLITAETVKIVSSVRSDTEISLTIGSDTAYVNGVEVRKTIMDAEHMQITI